MIHNFIPKHQQTDELNKTTRYASSDYYVDSDSGDEQYSVNSKETSFDNILNNNISKTNSLSSYIEVYPHPIYLPSQKNKLRFN